MSLADAIYYQALIYIRAGRPQEAIPFLRRAQMLHSGLGRTNQATLLEAINLCWAYAEIGDSPAARRACSDITYLLRSPNPPFKTRVLVNLATLDVASGNYIQAIERLNEAIASGTLEMGSSAILSALKLRAQAYAGIGKYANAYRDASHYAEGQRTASEEDQSFAVEAVRTRAELNERDMRRIELQQALSYARNMSRQRQIQLILSCTIFFIIMAAGLLLYISRMRHRRMVVQRAENKLAMITDINHEIRGPLASMSLLISALRNRSSLPEAHAALVEQIDRGAQQVISLLSESLEFTKLQ